MKRWPALLCVSMMCTGAFAAKGPEVNLVDDKLSVNVDSIGLGRLLRLLDLATGMQSKVPPELANRNVSVKFSGLSLSDGVRKIFQGYPYDYVVVAGQGIIVTAASQAITTAESQSVPYNAQPAPQPIDQFSPDFAQAPAIQGQQQPGMVQTPFGPMANPRAQQGQVGQPNVPLTIPGQQNGLFQNGQQNGLFQNGQPQPQPQGIPGQQPGTQFGNPSPFGTPSSFGTPSPTPPANQNNGLFGAVPVFGAPGAQQR